MTAYPPVYGVFDRLPEGVVLMDPDLRVFFANQAADRILGVRRMDPPPKGWSQYYQVLMPDGKTPFPIDQWPIVRAVHGERTEDVEMMIVNPNLPDGALILVAGQPLQDEDGHVVGGAAVFRDASDAKNARRAGANAPEVRRILVIDDDPAVRRTVCAVLRKGGFEPVEAADGRAGMQAMNSGAFALVITDLLMPGQEGIETIARIKEIDPGLPVLAISGVGDDDYSPLQDALLLGADGTLAKPFEIERLLAAVRALVQH